jgi:hypothetical protein
MEIMVVLSIIYWISVVVIFSIGLIRLIINAMNKQPVQGALKLVILSVVMVVIGAGACALMMSGINIH